MTLLFSLLAAGLIGTATVQAGFNPSSVTNLKCDTSATEYYTILSNVEPFYGSSASVPSSNATKVESHISLGCVNSNLELSGKKFQEWKMDLCSMQVRQPCPSSSWGYCSGDYTCEDIWTEGSNTAFFYVETYPNPGNVYWDPSDEQKQAETYDQCFSKYAVLQQLQGALTKEYTPDLVVKQDNKIIDGVILTSVRYEAAERPGDVKIPDSTMSAHIQMDSASSSICAPRKSSSQRCTDGAHKPVSSRLPQANIVPILSPEAQCPTTKSFTNSVARNAASCDEIVDPLMALYFKEPHQNVYNQILKCLDAEDREEIMNKYASALETAFVSAKQLKQVELMRDSISLMIIMPSKSIVNRAVALIDSIAATESHDVVLSLVQMIVYSPIVESIGIPTQLTSIINNYVNSSDNVAKYNALLLLASIARRTGLRSEVISAENVNKLPLLIRLDMLRNAGNAYSQNEFWRILMSSDASQIKNMKLIYDAISNRSDKDLIKLTLFEKFSDIPSFHWNVSVPEFSYKIGDQKLLGADYLHKAFAGVDYESCNDHSVRKFQYNVNANTHLTLYYLDKTYQLWEVIIDEQGSSDSTSRTDYVRLVWRNDVYYNGPVINLDCRSIHLNLFNKRFDYPTASATFQIGPVPVRVSMFGSATIDVQFDGEVCPLQAKAKGLLDPSIYNSVTGSACAGIFVVKACIEVNGAFKTHLKPGFEASLTTCPHLSVCPSADLTFTNNELSIDGTLKLGPKTYKKVFGDWKFNDVVKPLIEKGKCINL